MKTNFKTFIAVCVLSVAGIAGANASTTEASNNSSAFSANAKLAAEAFFQIDAQMVTKRIADKAEEKAIQEMVDEGYSAATESDSELRSFAFKRFHSALSTIYLQKEAELVTKLTADRQEAKALNQLPVDERLAENK